MIQMLPHLLDQGNPFQRHTMAKAVSAYLSSSTSDSKPSTASGTQTSVGTEETVQFMMMGSLLSEPYESWLQHRHAFLQHGVYHAYMQHTHGRSMDCSSFTQPSTARSDSAGTSGGTGKESGGNDDIFSIIQPVLVYTGLIEQLRCFFKVKKANVAVVQAERSSKESGADDGGSLEGHYERETVERKGNCGVLEGIAVVAGGHDACHRLAGGI